MKAIQELKQEQTNLHKEPLEFGDSGLSALCDLSSKHNVDLNGLTDIALSTVKKYVAVIHSLGGTVVWKKGTFVELQKPTIAPPNKELNINLASPLPKYKEEIQRFPADPLGDLGSHRRGSFLSWLVAERGVLRGMVSTAVASGRKVSIKVGDKFLVEEVPTMKELPNVLDKMRTDVESKSCV